MRGFVSIPCFLLSEAKKGGETKSETTVEISPIFTPVNFRSVAIQPKVKRRGQRFVRTPLSASV